MRARFVVVIALGTLLGSVLCITPVDAQAVRLTRTHPNAFMVDPRSGSTTVRLLGENTTDQDIRWTSRLFRYYVRRQGDAKWSRLFLNPQGNWYEDRADLAPLLQNGEIVGWGAGQQTIELPNHLYFRSPGSLEFKVEKGHWKERQVVSGNDTTFVADYVVEAASNVLRVPVRPAPQAAPTVTAVDPAYIAALGPHGRPTVITVRAENLHHGATATVGPRPCEIVSSDPVGGILQCRVPKEMQAKPGMYLVGVSTSRGGARQLGRLTVQAPLELARPSPASVMVTDTGVAVVLGYQGGTPLGARIRSAGSGWAHASIEPAGARAMRVRIPPALASRPGTIEMELSNAAGPALARLLVCGGGGEQPKGCPLSVAARTPAGQAPETAAPAVPRPPAQRVPVVIDPRNPVALRPQPEPPGLAAVPLAARATLRLADESALTWRRVDGSTRLVLLDAGGETVRVFEPGARPFRDRAGTLFVRVADGVIPVGKLRPSP